jgi:hypothetical protein
MAADGPAGVADLAQRAGHQGQAFGGGVELLVHMQVQVQIGLGRGQQQLAGRAGRPVVRVDEAAQQGAGAAGGDVAGQAVGLGGSSKAVCGTSAARSSWMRPAQAWASSPSTDQASGSCAGSHQSTWLRMRVTPASQAHCSAWLARAWMSSRVQWARSPIMASMAASRPGFT